MYSTKRLVEAANELGHEVHVVDALKCYMNISSGEKDYGNIDYLQENDDGFQLEGDFGSVTIIGGTMESGIK